MKFNKYIVLKEDGRWGMSLGYVEFHRELATTEELAQGMVKGGGRFKIDHDEKKILFYGKSDDFGYPKDIDVALASCYYQVRDEIEDLEFCRTHEESDLKDYTLWYRDELGDEVEVSPVRQASPMDLMTYGMNPVSLRDIYYPPMAKGKNSKNQTPKDAKKKAKAKRRAQKQARKRR